MCDESTFNDQREFLRKNPMTRRHFHKLSAGIAMTALLPPLANALDVVEQDVLIDTPDGRADAYLVHPATGKYPGVLVWPDAIGLRPAVREMGKRLAQSGYAVLVINPYYRNQKAPVFSEGVEFNEETRATLGVLRKPLNAETNFSDATAFISYLDSQAAVDTSRKIGTAGYCMGGPMVMRTAAIAPGRVGAGATFHGGGMATDADDSPHLLVPKMKADFLIAIAENDDARSPDDKVVLREAFAASGLDAEIEVYEGTVHGWCPIDSRAYNEAQAERAWSRMLTLFEKALA